ncbi:unnamed protein product [Ceratitis capitata]|uniref:(Mediterranean fruit fly) hypothetical protein n=1 Tax=Ceratitis capitata TaxID=7213 RepID=A0A811V4W3_CERCA|nr:unnamed protein product [Ceratitis capitata]
MRSCCKTVTQTAALQQKKNILKETGKSATSGNGLLLLLFVAGMDRAGSTTKRASTSRSTVALALAMAGGWWLLRAWMGGYAPQDIHTYTYENHVCRKGISICLSCDSSRDKHTKHSQQQSMKSYICSHIHVHKYATVLHGDLLLHFFSFVLVLPFALITKLLVMNRLFPSSTTTTKTDPDDYGKDIL